MGYAEYIASAAWAERRRSYWSSHPQACAMCGTGERVELHHLVYVVEQRGLEPDDDLLPLCHDHHEGVHLFHAAKADELTLRAATAEYVAGVGVTLEAGESKPAPRNHDAWEIHVSVACPECRAAAGESCVRVVHGRRQAIRAVHKRRKATAARLAEES